MRAALFDPAGAPPTREGGLSTFLPALNEVTAGLAPGELWVFTGHPGAGKSMLVTQLALHWLFEHHVPVTLYSLRDPLFAVWTRMLANAAHVALSSARQPTLSEDAAQRVADAARRLAGSPLRVRTRRPVTVGGEIDAALSPEGTRLLVIDDAHFFTDPDLVAKLSRWARAAGIAVVLTAPTAHLYAPHPHAPRGVTLLAPWREIADLAAEIRWTSCDPEPDTHRLELLYHRWGPVRGVEMHFEPFYGRFRPVNP